MNLNKGKIGNKKHNIFFKLQHSYRNSKDLSFFNATLKTNLWQYILKIGRKKNPEKDIACKTDSERNRRPK